jgi:hypothetical protein
MDAGCTPYVVISTDVATETALVDDGTIRAMYVTGTSGGGALGGLFYAECTSGCATQTPSFALIQVPYSSALNPVHLAAAPRTGGGIVAAVVADDLGVLQEELYFNECAGQCTDAGSWVMTKVDLGLNDVRPGVAMLGPVRAIAYGAMNNTNYAECASGCSSPGSWVLARADGQHVNNNVRVGLHDAGTELVREVAEEQGRVRSCTGGCTGGVGWSSSNANVGTIDRALSYIGTPTQRLAGVSLGGSLHYTECTSVPCSALWMSQPPLLNVASDNSQIDLDITPQGGPSILFTNPSNELQVAQISVGLLSASPVTGCGQTLIGTQPSQLISPSGGISVLYATPTGVRFHAP